MPRSEGGPGEAGRRRVAAMALAELVLSLDPGHPVRVGIDGVDGAGKSRVADELAALVRGRGRPCIRASIDGFHRPRARRYRRGRMSPEGYYRDSFDLRAFRRELLEPLGPGGTRRYRPRIFDHKSDRAVTVPPEEAPPDAVALVDGIFLLRPELRDCWDLSIFVDVQPETGARRASQRDQATASAEVLEELYRNRYLPAQRRYLENVRPSELADVLVLNDDLAAPTVLVRARVR